MIHVGISVTDVRREDTSVRVRSAGTRYWQAPVLITNEKQHSNEGSLPDHLFSEQQRSARLL